MKIEAPTGRIRVKMVKRLFISTTPEVEEITGQRTKIDNVRALFLLIRGGICHWLDALFRVVLDGVDGAIDRVGLHQSWIIGL